MPVRAIRYRFLCCLLLLTGSFVDAPVGLAQPVVQEIRFERTSSREERVLLVVENFRQPQAFDLAEPAPRLVFDFIDAQLCGLVSPSIDTTGTLIEKIRVGRHHAPRKKIRVVLDLAPDYDYNVNQVFFEKNNVYAIMVTRPE